MSDRTEPTDGKPIGFFFFFLMRGMDGRVVLKEGQFATDVCFSNSLYLVYLISLFIYLFISRGMYTGNVMTDTHVLAKI